MKDATGKNCSPTARHEVVEMVPWTTPACSTRSSASLARRSPPWSRRPRPPPEEGCRRLKIDYEILPTVFDPADAIAPGAPVIHADKTTQQRVADAQRKHRRANPRRIRRRRSRAGSVGGEPIRVPSPRNAVQHAALENPWRSCLGRWVTASSTSAPARKWPFLTRRALADVFDLGPDKVRVFCERVGGGFWRQAGRNVCRGHSCTRGDQGTGTPRKKLELTRTETIHRNLDAASHGGSP